MHLHSHDRDEAPASASLHPLEQCRPSDPARTMQEDIKTAVSASPGVFLWGRIPESAVCYPYRDRRVPETSETCLVWGQNPVFGVIRGSPRTKNPFLAQSEGRHAPKIRFWLNPRVAAHQKSVFGSIRGSPRTKNPFLTQSEGRRELKFRFWSRARVISGERSSVTRQPGQARLGGRVNGRGARRVGLPFRPFREPGAQGCFRRAVVRGAKSAP